MEFTITPCKNDPLKINVMCTYDCTEHSLDFYRKIASIANENIPTDDFILQLIKIFDRSE